MQDKALVLVYPCLMVGSSSIGVKPSEMHLKPTALIRRRLVGRGRKI